MRPWESVPAPGAAGRDGDGRDEGRGPALGFERQVHRLLVRRTGRPPGARALPGHDAARTGRSAPAARPA
jgi:hypothetical protein